MQKLQIGAISVLLTSTGEILIDFRCRASSQYISPCTKSSSRLRSLLCIDMFVGFTQPHSYTIIPLTGQRNVPIGVRED